MLIFKQEQEDGLTKLLKPAKARTLSYCVPIEKWEPNTEVFTGMLKAWASEHELHDDGLYPTKSILVSTVWNLNDDVFDKYETWMARKTPEDKPTNNNHDEKQIVGHMTGNWAIDDNGALIPDDTTVDNLPNLYHIFNTAVIYASFSEPEMVQRAEKLIAEIEAGNKFVSMEAYFRGFDYALKNSTGEMQILQRNEKTAFLTKHLRTYGGTGEYQNYKVGRLLRNITFSGKGYVDKPANPSSIIFDKNTSIDFTSTACINELNTTSGVYINQKPIIGEETNMTQELQTKIDELTVANTELNAKLVEITGTYDVLFAKYTGSENTQADLLQKLANLTVENEKLNTENVQAKLDIENLDILAQVAQDLQEQLSVANASLTAQALAQKQLDRKNKLLLAGYNDVDAQAKIELFASLNDEQFGVLVNELTIAKTHKCVEEVKVLEPTKASVDEVLELETVEATVNPSVNINISTDAVMNAIRNDLANAFSQLLDNTNKPTNKK